MKFIECESCNSEFAVVSDKENLVEYCPFCGDTVEVFDDDLEEDE